MTQVSNKVSTFALLPRRYGDIKFNKFKKFNNYGNKS